MSIKKLDHISILARDAKAVTKFYQDFLGFELTGEREFSDLGMKIYDLKTRSEFLEVIEPLNKDTPMTDGIKHVAYLSDDIEADFADFKERGARLLHKSVQRHGAAAFFFVSGPAKTMLEIIQYEERGDHAQR